MTKNEYQEKLAFFDANEEAMGPTGYAAAVAAIEAEHFAEVKAKQKAKWDKARLAVPPVILKGHILADLPGLQVTLSDFDANGEDAGPVMTVSITKDVGDGKSKTVWLYGGPVRKGRGKNGKGFATGPIVVIKAGRKLSGKVFGDDNTLATMALANALGYTDKGEYGWSNVLKSHGFKRGDYYEYQAYLDHVEAAKGSES